MWVKKGGVIFDSLPYASVLYHKYWDVLCHHCYQTAPTPGLECKECRVPVYCSRRCMEADSLTHSLECQVLCCGEPEDPTTWLLLRYRFKTY